MIHRIWSRVGKIVGSLFLFSGGTVSAGFLAGILMGHASGGVLAMLSILMVVFGLAPASLGGWLLYAASNAERQAIREHFFRLLQANQGRLSLLDFAAATRLEPASARDHLNAWAKEFSASFEVSDGGDIYYVFSTEPWSLPETRNLEAWGQMVRQFLQSA